MKNLTLFAVPVIVVIFILGGVFVWKIITPAKTQVATTQGTLPNSLDSASGAKPGSPFSGLFGGGTQVTPIPTPTPATAAEMNADLQTVGDDGGLADFASLDSDLSGL